MVVFWKHRHSYELRLSHNLDIFPTVFCTNCDTPRFFLILICPNNHLQQSLKRREESEIETSCDHRRMHKLYIVEMNIG